MTARAGQRFTAGTAYQMVAMPDGGVAVLHQRGVVDPIRPTSGGYGGFNPCDAIVHAAVSAVAADGTVKTGPALAGLVLAVDMAISPDGRRAAFVSMGNATNQASRRRTTGPQLTRVFVTDLATAIDETIGCKPDGTHGPCLPPSTTIIDSSNGTTTHDQRLSRPDPQVGRAADRGRVRGRRRRRRRSRASRRCCRWRTAPTSRLSTDSRADTGHFLFHANAGGFMACASCHIEGDDDGRVWNFDCSAANPTAAMGPRRTQSLQTGLRGTEPFHWNGDEADFTQLMSDVFVTRMSGPKLDAPTDGRAGDVDRRAAEAEAARPPRMPTAVAARRGAVQRHAERRLRQLPCGRALLEQPDRRRRHRAARSRFRRCSGSAPAARSCTTAARRRCAIASTRPAAAATGTASPATCRRRRSTTSSPTCRPCSAARSGLSRKRVRMPPAARPSSTLSTRSSASASSRLVRLVGPLQPPFHARPHHRHGPQLVGAQPEQVAGLAAIEVDEPGAAVVVARHGAAADRAGDGSVRPCPPLQLRCRDRSP